MISPSRFLATFFLTALAVACLYLLDSAYFQPLIGDLTRTGHWPERDYGWNARNPAFKADTNELTLATNVLVLGDSFSERNIWQTYLHQRDASLNTATLDFNDLCPDQLPAFIDSHPLKTGLVVLESVERAFVYRFDGSLCTHAVNPAETPLRQELPGLQYDIERRTRQIFPPEDLVWITAANLNILAMNRWPQKDFLGYSDNVVLNRSDLFSSRRSDRLLFLGGDIGKFSWPPGSFDRSAAALRKLDADLKSRGFGLLVMVVPDKSTVYRDYLKNPHLLGTPIDWNAFFSHAGISAVDLEGPFRQSIATGVVDFYLPDDTHLSLYGYQEMARIIGSRAVLPPASR